MAWRAHARPRIGWPRIALVVMVSFTAMPASTAQSMSDVGVLHSIPPDVWLRAGRMPIGDIEVMRSDLKRQKLQTETIGRKSVEYFGI